MSCVQCSECFSGLTMTRVGGCPYSMRVSLFSFFLFSTCLLAIFLLLYCVLSTLYFVFLPFASLFQRTWYFFINVLRLALFFHFLSKKEETFYSSFLRFFTFSLSLVFEKISTCFSQYSFFVHSSRVVTVPSEPTVVIIRFHTFQLQLCCTMTNKTGSSPRVIEYIMVAERFGS